MNLSIFEDMAYLSGGGVSGLIGLGAILGFAPLRRVPRESLKSIGQISILRISLTDSKVCLIAAHHRRIAGILVKHNRIC